MIQLGRNPFLDALTPKRRREVENVTVCVAAIANNGMIFAASDRMLSTDEIAYEPESSKVWTITTAITALWSGDAAIQAEVLGLVRRDVQALLANDENPPDWFNVSDIVDLYVAHWSSVKRKRASLALLAPLGLTMEEFVAGNHGLGAATSDNLTNALVGYQLPFASCIIAGIDNTGSHIWQVHSGVASCADATAFAAIGAGTRHADSQMMAGRHSREKTPSETLTLIHAAKKRAEVSPSVGSETDVVWIGPALGSSGEMPPGIVYELDESYAAMIAAERGALSAAIEHFADFMTTLGHEDPRPQEADDE